MSVISVVGCISCFSGIAEGLVSGKSFAAIALDGCSIFSFFFSFTFLTCVGTKSLIGSGPIGTLSSNLGIDFWVINYQW
ncbi:MAG: hypothetical protein IPP56_05420 [Bacteroidetes bacterium]|nr:hypothetical protein [Bacteroidota bacterium]